MSEVTRVIGQPIRRDIPMIPSVSTGPGRGPVKEGKPVVAPVTPQK